MSGFIFGYLPKITYLTLALNLYLRLRRSQSLIAQAQSGKQEPIRFERQGHKKRPSKMESLFKLPLARLELAPRVNPDWILSPTRLPIPPQGHVAFIIKF